jgi:hypothetical protein
VDDVGQLLQYVAASGQSPAAGGQSPAAAGQSPPPGNDDILSGHPLKGAYVQLFKIFFVICDLKMTNERT